MPYNRKRRRPRRRTYARKKRRIKKAYRSRNRYPLSRLRLGGFPETKLVKLRYCDEFQIDASVDASVFSFSANSIYDPNSSGVGHQPLGFDQHMSVYQNYQVVGSRCSIQRIPINSASIGLTAYWGAHLSRTGLEAKAQNYTWLAERPEFRLARYIPADESSRNQQIMTLTYSQRKYWSKEELVNNSDFDGTIVTSPTNECFFTTYSVGTFGQDPGNLHFRAQIDYIVKLTNRKEIPQSV